jgi:hypothetical protein
MRFSAGQKEKFCAAVETYYGHGIFFWSLANPFQHGPGASLEKLCDEVMSRVSPLQSDTIFDVHVHSKNHFCNFFGTFEDVGFRRWIPPFSSLTERGSEDYAISVENDKHLHNMKEIADILCKNFKKDHMDYVVQIQIPRSLSKEDSLIVAQFMSLTLKDLGYYRDDEGTCWFSLNGADVNDDKTGVNCNICIDGVPYVMSLSDRYYSNEVWFSFNLSDGFKRKKSISEESPRKMAAVPLDLVQCFNEIKSQLN